MINCGSAPIVVGHFRDELPAEMMFYLYLPVKMASSDDVRVPERLARYLPILDNVLKDNSELDSKYIYITAKTMFVSGSSPGNRPGWHIDGFGSCGDINYTWANENPTEFAVQEFRDIPDDDAKSMVEITKQIKQACIKTYENNAILRLDESVVHRVSPRVVVCLRSFVKITVSRHRFAKIGNSHNYLFDYNWNLSDRTQQRNLDHV